MRMGKPQTSAGKWLRAELLISNFYGCTVQVVFWKKQENYYPDKCCPFIISFN